MCVWMYICFRAVSLYLQTDKQSEQSQVCTCFVLWIDNWTKRLILNVNLNISSFWCHTHTNKRLTNCVCEHFMFINQADQCVFVCVFNIVNKVQFQSACTFFGVSSILYSLCVCVCVSSNCCFSIILAKTSVWMSKIYTHTHHITLILIWVLTLNKIVFKWLRIIFVFSWINKDALRLVRTCVRTYSNDLMSNL